MTDYKQALETTVMAIREELMTYYKGDCVSRFTRTNVRCYDRRSDFNHLFERREEELHNEKWLMINGQAILKLSANPDRLSLCENVLDRSATLRDVKKAVLEFMHKYLQGVTIESNTEFDTETGSADRAAILQNSPSNNRRPTSFFTTMGYDADFITMRPAALWERGTFIDPSEIEDE